MTVTRRMAYAVLVLALGLLAAMPAVAQDAADQTVTVKITLTADQVAALKAYRDLAPRGPAMLPMPMPASTPDYTVVPTVKPVVPFKEWVEGQLAERLAQMVSEVERRDGEALAGEVHALTAEQKKQLRAQMKALKEKK